MSTKAPASGQNDDFSAVAALAAALVVFFLTDFFFLGITVIIPVPAPYRRACQYYSNFYNFSQSAYGSAWRVDKLVAQQADTAMVCKYYLSTIYKLYTKCII